MDTENTKPWYASTTVWANIMQVAVGLAVSSGLVDSAAGTTIANEGPAVIVGIVTAILGVWGVYSRVTATKAITPTVTGSDPAAK